MAKTFDLSRLSDDELIELNHKIVALLKARQRQSHHQSILNFERGARISFQGPEGRLLHGTIARVNQKSLTIDTEHGTWRIDPSFVVKEKATATSKRKVLKLHQTD